MDFRPTDDEPSKYGPYTFIRQRKLYACREWWRIVVIAPGRSRATVPRCPSASRNTRALIPAATDGPELATEEGDQVVDIVFRGFERRDARTQGRAAPQCGDGKPGLAGVDDGCRDGWNEVVGAVGRSEADQRQGRIVEHLPS